MAVNMLAAYQNTSIQTASKADLTLMLYDGAIKFCNLGMMALEKQDIQKSHINIIKAQKIITELKDTLDMKYPVAKEFDNVYTIILDYLMQANMKKDEKILSVALEFIREMRDTWKQVIEINKGKAQ